MALNGSIKRGETDCSDSCANVHEAGRVASHYFCDLELMINFFRVEHNVDTNIASVRIEESIPPKIPAYEIAPESLSANICCTKMINFCLIGFRSSDENQSFSVFRFKPEASFPFSLVVIGGSEQDDGKGRSSPSPEG